MIDSCTSHSFRSSRSAPKLWADESERPLTESAAHFIEPRTAADSHEQWMTDLALLLWTFALQENEPSPSARAGATAAPDARPRAQRWGMLGPKIGEEDPQPQPVPKYEFDQRVAR